MQLLLNGLIAGSLAALIAANRLPTRKGASDDFDPADAFGLGLLGLAIEGGHLRRRRCGARGERQQRCNQNQTHDDPMKR